MQNLAAGSRTSVINSYKNDGQCMTSSYKPSSSATYNNMSAGNKSYSGNDSLIEGSINRTRIARIESNYGSHIQSSYPEGSDVDVNDFDANTSGTVSMNVFGTGAISNLETNRFATANSYGATLSNETTGLSSSSTFEADCRQNLYRDPNPQILRLSVSDVPVTYTQNVQVRFLKPPPVPPSGVSFLSCV